MAWGGMGTARRALAGLGVVVAALAIGGIVVAGDDPPPDGVRAVGGAGSSTSPSGATTAPPSGPDATYVMGDVGDIAVDVSPGTDLADGELLTLTVEGADALPADAIVLMCTGEVRGDTPSTAVDGCDAGAVTGPDGQIGPGVAEGEQQVAVSRRLRVGSRGGGPGESGLYDCATEPAGCILVLAPFRLPPTAVAIALGFADGPVATPEMAASPAVQLVEHQAVTVEASGLRPHAAHDVGQCVPVDGEVAEVQPWSCDWETYTPLVADAEGRVRGEVRVRAAIYPSSGRVDCTVVACSLVIGAEVTAGPAAAPIAFGADVVAPVPVLTIDPPGPYADGQEVTVRGTGFPPGYALDGHLAQCPADRDTRDEERCQYGFAAAVVADDGTFASTGRVSAALLFTGPCATTGCVIGWVLPHGTTVAPVPIEVTGLG